MKRILSFEDYTNKANEEIFLESRHQEWETTQQDTKDQRDKKTSKTPEGSTPLGTT